MNTLNEYTKWTQTMTYVNTTEDTMAEMADKLSAEILKILKEEAEPISDWNRATNKDRRLQFYDIKEIEYAIEQGITSYLLDLRDQRLEGFQLKGRQRLEGLPEFKFNKNETETNSK